MSAKTNNTLSLLTRIDRALEAADKNRTFEDGLHIAKEVMGLLGLENIQSELKSFPRLKANPSWTKNAPDYEDRKASYALAENNDRNVDFKLFWVTKPGKRIVSNLVALTPNFEDEPFYSNKNVGVDFVLSEYADRLIVVLSSNYKIRALEIHKRLSNTQKKIFEKWAQEFDFSNKAQFHKVLWDSFDIQPLNKEFYIDISSFFNELTQHLENKDILDKKHRPQFVNRLIGRIIFCWFIRKKEIIAEDAGYFDAEGKLADKYYAEKLETLFFKVLNTPVEERGSGADDRTPFLNGGLFEPKESDLYGLYQLSFPADYFERFYSFLNRYNFTTDESTSDYQQVAIDPEMLGRIFENLLAEEIEETGEQARKAKGAFYTPREIVDYMCRESLRAYIAGKLGEDARKGELLQLLFDKKEHELDLKGGWGNLGAYKNRIIEALDTIKIIDPACGSGAFPIGMLQIMLSIYGRLDMRLDHYKTKLGIIKNNIFGIDIEPMAVEIARLRTWLSLIVDENVNLKGENKGIDTLPNLDFKFICANSLIPLANEDTKQLFDTVKKEELIFIRDKYFSARTKKSKEDWHRKYEKIIEYKKSGNMFSSKRECQLRTYHPFNSENISGFFDADCMFGIKEGFDVVIGNPPYVNISKVDKKLLSQYQEKYESASYGRFDLYVTFIELAINLLNEGGVQSFIVPDKVCYQKYAQNIRNIILNKCQIMNIMDLSGIKIFESAVVDNVIYLLRRNDNYDGPVSIIHLDYKGVFKGIDKLNRHEVLQKTFKTFPENMFRLSIRERDVSILNKIDSKSEKIKEYCYISFGAQPGVLNKFVFNQTEEPDKLNINKKVQKKFIRGRNIERYFVNYSGDVIYYLPDELHRPAFPELFENEKIVVSEISKDIKAAYDTSGYYSNEKTVVLVKWGIFSNVSDKVMRGRGIKVNNELFLKTNTLSTKYIISFINSSLLNYYFKKMLSDGLNVYPDNLREMPIIIIKNQKPFIKLVDQILDAKKHPNADTRIFEDKIDDLVFDLYNLSREEREIVRAA